MSEFPSTPLRLIDLLTDSQDFRKPMVILMATVYDSKRIQIIINKEKKRWDKVQEKPDTNFQMSSHAFPCIPTL